jgi:hypothetical protein
MTEDWELDFNNPPRVLPPVQCEHCLKTAHKPHFVVKHFGHSTKQLAFCDELCEQMYYLNKLRGLGV